MSNYSCNICDEYKTLRIGDMSRHLLKKKKCMSSLRSYNFSKDQLLVLCLTCNTEKENIKNEIEHLTKSSIMFNNRPNLIALIQTTYKDKLRECPLCNEEYDKFNDLKKHILLECYLDNLKKNEEEKKSVEININSNNINQTINQPVNNIINNITNNITNIYIDIKNPLPFDEEWNVSNVNVEKFIFKNHMYSSLLSEILNNEINLNVIIEKDNESGLVYKNDIDKYIKMKSQDIVDKTMLKLKKHLLDINTNISDDYVVDVILSSKHNINKKYDAYNNNNSIKEKVSGIIKDIYDTKRDKAISLCKNTDEKESHDFTGY